MGVALEGSQGGQGTGIRKQKPKKKLGLAR